MFKGLQHDWQQLQQGKPGSRFQRFRAERQKRRGGIWSAGRVATLGLGVLLIVASPFVGAIPGPGGMIVLALGLALLAAEVKWAARLLDWAEPRMWRLWEWTKRTWARLPDVAKVGLSALGVVAIGGCGYLGYVLLFSGS